MKAGNTHLVLIISLGFSLRLLFFIFGTNLNSVNHFEYGAIAENLHEGNGYALFFFEGDKLEIGTGETSIPFKSAYMPPFYPGLLYLFFFIDDITIRNFSILFFQIIISTLLIYLIFKITLKLFDRNAALFAAMITAILPEFIYTTSLSGTTIYFQLGIVVVFMLTSHLNSKKNSVAVPIISGLILGTLILLRSEVVFFVIILFIYFLFSKQIRIAVIIAITTLLFIAPWQIRNIAVFKDMVPLSTSFGTNLYRGHNPYAVGVWADDVIEKKQTQFKNDPNFELRMNEFLVSKAINNIYHNLGKELEYAIEKIYNLWIFNPDDSRTTHYLYFIPWFTLIILFLISLVRTFNWKNQKYIFLFLIYFHLIVIMFFCLPRYQTMMKIALIPFAGNGIWILFNKLKLWKNKYSSNEND